MSKYRDGFHAGYLAGYKYSSEGIRDALTRHAVSIRDEPMWQGEIESAYVEQLQRMVDPQAVAEADHSEPKCSES